MVNLVKSDVKVLPVKMAMNYKPGVNKLVRVYTAQKRKIHEGDKMAAVMGNKGVVSRVMEKKICHSSRWKVLQYKSY